ncbi:sugar phosphate nucleotidyltransferase [Marinobacterium sp. xm-a-127]|uniref:sugar phosphate nucleotidyltransferase n=1 Tax=Marinobacterium sp. xm-a-127 TaxID=2497736 RepID=UPI00352C6AA3
MQPAYPATDFGYIESISSGVLVQGVKSFHEKPSQKTAQSIIDQGNFYWNFRIFCLQAGLCLEELKFGVN